MVDVARLEMQVDSRSVKAATKDVEGLGKQSSLTTTAIKAFGAAFVALGAGNILGKIANDTRQFSTAISQLSAITGATGQDLKFFREQSLEIGRTTTLSASQAATAFQLIASAKPDLLDSRDALAAVTKEAVTLAEAASIDLTSAAQTVGVALNQFGAEADQANRFVNVLAAGSKFGSSLITQTADALKNAGTAAALAGLSFEEANVGVQLLAKGGLFAAEAGTGFRQVLLKLESQTNNEFKPSVVGLAGALENLAAENMSLTDIMDMFGAEAAKSAATMIEQADSARLLENQLTGTQTATEQAATNFNNLDGDLLSLNSVMESLAISIGERAEPAMRTIAQAVTDFAQRAVEFVQSEKFTRFLDIAITGLQIFSVMMGVKIVAALGTSIIAFQKTATAIGLFGKALALAGGPITLTIGALYGLYEILNRVVGTNTDNLREQLQRAANEGLAPLTEHTEALRNRQAELQRQVENLSDPLRQSSFEVNALQSAQAELEQVTTSLSEAELMLASRLDAAGQQANSAEFEFQDLDNQFSDLVGTLNNGFDPSLEAVTLSLEELAGQTEYNIEVTDKLNTSYNQVRDSLSSKMTQLGMNAREQFIYNEQMKLGTDATLEARLEIERLAGEYFDAELAQKELTTATENNITTLDLQKNAVENIQRSFGELIYETLEDGKLNFKDFFSSVLNGFKRLVSELAAQKIMDAIFGDSGLDGFLSKLSGGFSSIISSIAGGLSSIVSSVSAGISSAVGTITGAGATAVTSAGTSAVTSAATTAATTAGVTAGTTGAITGTTAAGIAATTAATTAAAAGGVNAAALAAATGVPAATAGFTAGGSGVLAGQTAVTGLTSAGGGAAVTSAATPAAAGTSSLLATLGPAALFAYLFFKWDVLGLNRPNYPSFEELPPAVQAAEMYEAFLQAASPFAGGLGPEDTEGMAAFEPMILVDLYHRIKTRLGDDAGTTLEQILNNPLFDKSLLELVEGDFRMGINRVPNDMIAQIHKGERVVTAGKADMMDRLAEEMTVMRSDFNQLMLTVAKATTRTARIEDRWDKNGLPPTRT